MTNALGVGAALERAPESCRIRHVELEAGAAVRAGNDVAGIHASIGAIGARPPERALHGGRCSMTTAHDVIRRGAVRGVARGNGASS